MGGKKKNRNKKNKAKDAVEGALLDKLNTSLTQESSTAKEGG